MLSSMNSFILLNCFLLFPLVLNFVSPDENTPVSTVLAEAFALIALRQTLNSGLLNSNWVGQQCSSLNQTTWTGLRCINNRVVSIKLEGIGLSCVINDPFALAILTELTLVSFKNNSITGTMFNLSSNLKLTSIDLSMNQFYGPISNSLLSLNLLESLQLHNNNLSGSIPPLNQTSLKLFNVSFNKLSGQIPTTSTLQSFDESVYFGNLDLCGPPSPNRCGPREYSPSNDNTGKGFKLFSESSIVVMFITLDVIGLIALSWIIFAFCKRRRKRITTMEKGNEISEEKIEEIITVEEQKKLVFVKGDGGFDLDELLKASAESLGQGSFGASYKAVLDDDRAFVVKRLRDVSPMTDKEFAGHIGDIAAFEHPNLFPLLGYYYSMGEKLLVYKFAQHGNLFDRIHGGREETTRIPFNWNSRLSIAKHIARAMEFLHKNTKDPNSVPHGNLKSSNVLLESDNMAHISDYGLLPLISAPLAPKRMAVYKSPEYQHSRRICKKSDVWGYGCLLLELVTRKFPAQRGMDGTQVVRWVHRAVREEWTCEVFDGEIAGQRGAMTGMFKLLQVALWCCEEEVGKRPEMGEVAREVEGIMPGSDKAEEEEEVSAER